MFVLGTWVRRSRQRIHRAAGYGVHAQPEMLRASAQHQTRIMGSVQRRIPEHSSLVDSAVIRGPRVWASRRKSRLSAAPFAELLGSSSLHGAPVVERPWRKVSARALPCPDGRAKWPNR